MPSASSTFKPSGSITWDSDEPVGDITWDKEPEKVEEPVPEPIPEEVSEYADMEDGWYRDQDTGEKFEVRKGKRL